jgi:hypothetical protein
VDAWRGVGRERSGNGNEVSAWPAAEKPAEHKEIRKMRFAVPCEGKRVAEQFGSASQFAFFDANPRSGHILQHQIVDAPGEGPG